LGNAFSLFLEKDDITFQEVMQIALRNQLLAGDHSGICAIEIRRVMDERNFFLLGLTVVEVSGMKTWGIIPV
jgi:hypothetical protein